MLRRPFGSAGGGRRVGRRIAGGKRFFQLLVELLFRLRSDLLGCDYRGSFIPASPWVPRALIGLKLQRP
jgi:hypothetical protein